mgnify:CR=1 FL=1
MNVNEHTTIDYIVDEVSLSEYLAIRKAVNWKQLSEKQAARTNTFFLPGFSPRRFASISLVTLTSFVVTSLNRLAKYSFTYSS